MAKSKKVSAPAAKPKVETVEEPKKGGPGLTRDPFDFSTAVDGKGNSCVVDDPDSQKHGLLNEFPANYVIGKHGALKKTDFANEAGWWDYKVASAEKTIEQYTNSLAEYKSNADTCRKYGNTEDRKRVMKLQTMRDDYMRIVKECEAEGIEVPDELKALATAAAAG